MIFSKNPKLLTPSAHFDVNETKKVFIDIQTEQLEMMNKILIRIKEGHRDIYHIIFLNSEHNKGI